MKRLGNIELKTIAVTGAIGRKGGIVIKIKLNHSAKIITTL